MKEAVSNLLYQIPIQGYLSMNMDGIPIAVKEVGGVEVTVPNNTLEQVNPEFKEGATVYVTEATAEQFVRYRDIKQTNSAIYRMERQLVFLEAFTQKAKEKTSKNVDFIARLLESVEDDTVTNIGKDMFAKMAEATYSKDDIITIPGEGKAGAGFDEYHVNHDELFELVIQLFYKEVKK
jgi:anionic cell wall polymer biosynthesis LytR-Cps2A-Psr (LCP) family protein